MEATPEQIAEGKAVIKVLSAVLERLVSANSKIASLDPGVITRFHALKPPSISVLAYLERIHKYASCSTECFILALIYIDRLIQRNNFLLTELNVHRVVITAIMLAAKFFDDQYFNNNYYAKVGGVPAVEMNSLEVEFLFRINFSLHTTSDLYHKYHNELVSHAVAAGPPSNTVPLSPPHPPQGAPFAGFHQPPPPPQQYQGQPGAYQGQQQQQFQQSQQWQQHGGGQGGSQPFFNPQAPQAANNNFGDTIPCKTIPFPGGGRSISTGAVA